MCAIKNGFLIQEKVSKNSWKALRLFVGSFSAKGSWNNGWVLRDHVSTVYSVYGMRYIALLVLCVFSFMTIFFVRSVLFVRFLVFYNDPCICEHAKASPTFGHLDIWDIPTHLDISDTSTSSDNTDTSDIRTNLNTSDIQISLTFRDHFRSWGSFNFFSILKYTYELRRFGHSDICVVSNYMDVQIYLRFRPLILVFTTL